MNPMRFHAGILALVGTATLAAAQTPLNAVRQSDNARPEVPFDITDGSKVDHFHSLRDSLINQATRKRVAWQTNDNDDVQTGRAWGVLSMTNVDPKPSIAATIQDMDERRGGPITEYGPLSGFYAAESLINRRLPFTAEAILDSLKAVRSRREILVRVCVLRGLDRREVILARIEAAVASAGDDERGQTQVTNLKEVRRCLIAEDYFRDRNNWPNRQPGPILPPDSGETWKTVLEPPIERFPAEKIDMGDNTHAVHFRKYCAAVEYRAAEALLAWHHGKSNDENLALTAARLLKLVPVKDSASALCQTIGLREPIAGEPKDPLDGFPAAQALALSGRTDVADEVINSLHTDFKLSQRELLLRAHVLRKLDRPDIMLVRINCTPRGGGNPFAGQLQQIESWFKTPGFFDNPAHWPSRAPQE